jgi:hypothetical protein
LLNFVEFSHAEMPNFHSRRENAASGVMQCCCGFEAEFATKCSCFCMVFLLFFGKFLLLLMCSQLQNRADPGLRVVV